MTNTEQSLREALKAIRGMSEESENCASGKKVHNEDGSGDEMCEEGVCYEAGFKEIVKIIDAVLSLPAAPSSEARPDHVGDITDMVPTALSPSEQEVEKAGRCTCECTKRDCPDVLYVEVCRLRAELDEAMAIISYGRGNLERAEKAEAELSTIKAWAQLVLTTGTEGTGVRQVHPRVKTENPR